MSANVHDVASYILEIQGSTSAMKLQKLLYYCQAWHLVWDEEKLFENDIEAWREGPVVREIWESHRGQYVVHDWSALGSPKRLTQDQRESVDVVLATYGHLSAEELSDRTHAESPWRVARIGLRAGTSSSRVISTHRMRDYYAARLNRA